MSRRTGLLPNGFFPDASNAGGMNLVPDGDDLSLVPSDITDRHWETGYNEAVSRQRVYLSAELGARHTYLINATRDAAGAGRLGCRFMVPTGVTEVVLSFYATKGPTFSDGTKFRAGIYQADGSTAVTDTLVTLSGTSPAQTTITAAVTPGTLYTVGFTFDGNGSTAEMQAYLSGLKVTATGWAYRRVHVRPAIVHENLEDSFNVDRGYRFSTASRVILYTDAPHLYLETMRDESGGITYEEPGVVVDGVPWGVVTSSTLNTPTLTQITLPGGRLHRVEIVHGAQLYSGSPAGTYVHGIFLPSSSQCLIERPIESARTLVVYGDSIWAGWKTTYPSLFGPVPLLRQRFPGRVVAHCLTARACYDDANSAALRQAFVEKIGRSGRPSDVLLAVGTNDWGGTGGNLWTAANFGTGYAALMDAIHAAYPDARIYCQTPIVRASESSNNTFGAGNALTDYRTQISTAQGARTAWSTLIDGSSGGTGMYPSTTELVADGVHPGDIDGTHQDGGRLARRLATVMGF